MARKSATVGMEQTGRVGQRRQVVIPREIFEKLRMRTGDVVAFTAEKDGILVKPKHPDPDDVLNAIESTLVLKARREMRQGKYVSLAELENALAHQRSPRRRKTA
jgi:AbrB family looped-hinge helix DNA binding protein